MDPKKYKLLRGLKFAYIFVFLLIILLVAPPHLFPPPYFTYLRFPTYLEKMPSILGISWPLTFEVYHLVAFVLAIIGAINILGIVSYPKFSKLAQFSSLAGLALSFLIFLFFLFIFMKVNVQISLIYTFYFLIFSGINLLTFLVLRDKKREDA